MSMDGGGPSGFAPGRHNHGVTNPPIFSDAADALLNKSNLPKRASGEAFFCWQMEVDSKGHCLEQKDLVKANWCSQLV